MNPATEVRTEDVRRFRIRLLIVLMLVVSALTLLALYLAQWSAAQADLQGAFDADVELLDRLQLSRTAAAKERCRIIEQRQRIRGAIEEDTFEDLYPNAQAELRDLFPSEAELQKSVISPPRSNVVPGKFYRFIDRKSGIIVPSVKEAGFVPPEEEAQLTRPPLPQSMQDFFFVRPGDRTVDQIIAVPIRARESTELLAIFVLGIKPVVGNMLGPGTGLYSGILVNRELRLPQVGQDVEARLGREILKRLPQSAGRGRKWDITIDGKPHWVHLKQLNPDSTYPVAYEVFVHQLPRLAFTQVINQQQPWTWQILSAGGALLLGGFWVSNLISRRLARPVEKLVVVSEEAFAERQKAEAKLETTTEELQRSARFSADASHQLKSPITVLRAGLDSLLAREGFPKEVYEELSSLVHQTYRLTGVVEDLLLLSRMDAGKLRLNLQSVDLTHLVEEWIDDLQAMPEAANLRVETDIPVDLHVAGEAKFTALVVQNLLDNARKYNRPDGVIRIRARAAKGQVEFRVANTGRGIPPEAQPYVFERFHRAGASEEIAGHGLGLNLARELVRLHGGELRLLRSDAEWTEFSALFLKAAPAARPVPLPK